MLEITKLKSKSYSLDIEIVNFTRLVYKTYDKLKHIAKENQQSIRFKLVLEGHNIQYGIDNKKGLN